MLISFGTEVHIWLDPHDKDLAERKRNHIILLLFLRKRGNSASKRLRKLAFETSDCFLVFLRADQIINALIDVSNICEPTLVAI